MTRDDIIRMARVAGFSESLLMGFDEELDYFAALVAAQEREACAKVCEQPIDEIQMTNEWSEYVYMDGQECADAIRARGNHG